MSLATPLRTLKQGGTLEEHRLANHQVDLGAWLWPPDEIKAVGMGPLGLHLIPLNSSHLPDPAELPEFFKNSLQRALFFCKQKSKSHEKVNLSTYAAPHHRP